MTRRPRFGIGKHLRPMWINDRPRRAIANPYRHFQNALSRAAAGLDDEPDVREHRTHLPFEVATDFARRAIDAGNTAGGNHVANPRRCGNWYPPVTKTFDLDALSSAHVTIPFRPPPCLHIQRAKARPTPVPAGV